MRDRSREQSGKNAANEGAGGESPAAEAAAQSGGSADPSQEESGAREPSGAGADERVKELTAELDALRDRYLRTVAEYENFRRRTERERAEGGVRAQAQVVEKLLEPLDDLQRVADFDEGSTTVHALLEGVKMVERKLSRLLESAGLETIAAEGQPFDPALHEALMTAPTDRRDEDDSVGQVFQNGYQFKGVLLRPARVQVRKYE